MREAGHLESHLHDHLLPVLDLLTWRRTRSQLHFGNFHRLRFGALLGLVALNHQLIPHLGAALEDAMRRKLQHALRAKIRPGNLERPNHLPQTDNFEVLVDQNQVKGEKHTDGVNRIGGANPYPTFRRKRSPAPQSDQPTADRARDLYPEATKNLLRIVLHQNLTISLSP